MTTFFSVDVETSGTDPFKYDLLTIGTFAVRDGLLLGSQYIRLDHRREVVWDEGTLTWWRAQNAEAKREIFSTKLERIGPLAAALTLASFVRTVGGDGFHDNVFVANPSSFDHAWIRKLFSETRVKDPFSYRTLCLRSAAWGASDKPWDETRRTHRPLIEHHALHDAQAQALDLIDLLRGRS